MKLVIDRFENGYAVCELPDGSFCDIPERALCGANEGDIVEITILADETKKRQAQITEKMRRLFED